MLKIMRGAVPVLLLVPPLLVGAPTAAQKRGKGVNRPVARALPGAGIAAAKAYVDQIYRELPRGTDWRTRRFAPELTALLDRERKEAAGEVGLIEADPFCGCQDTDSKYSFISSVAADGPGKATVTVRLQNGRFSTIRVDLVQSGGAWAIADIHTPEQPSLLSFLRQSFAAAAVAARAKALATLPAEWGYKGNLLKADNSVANTATLYLENRGGTLVGTYFNYASSYAMAEAATGTYANGECSLRIKGTLLSREKVLTGKCDRNSFTGVLTGKKGEFRNNFSFAGFDAVAARQRRDGEIRQALAQQAAQPAAQGSGVVFRMDDLGTGDLDYIDGELPADAAGGSHSSGQVTGSAGVGGLDAPAGTTWAYGRNRWVVARGGGCGPQAELLKGYCFGAVIRWMQNNPSAKSVTAIALSEPVPLGTWISRDTPVRYFYAQITRRGEGFAADKGLRGTAKVRSPNPVTCSPFPLKEGFVLTSLGPQGLQEAALFQCP